MKVSVVTAFILFSYFTFNDAFKLQPKIVNGYEAKPGQFPFFVFLHIQHVEPNKQLGCGGTIISDRWILTAAHCLVVARSLVVHFGKTRLDRAESTHVQIPVGDLNNFHIHSDVVLSESLVRNDIALIELPQKVEFSSNIQPAHLPTNCEAAEIVDVVAIGHGATSDNSGISPQLHFAHLKTLPEPVCLKEYPFLEGGNSVICAANKQLYQSICGGDSGGPLVTKSNGTLVGVSSFGKRAGCEDGEPQGFTNVHYHLKWIEDITHLNLSNC